MDGPLRSADPAVMYPDPLDRTAISIGRRDAQAVAGVPLVGRWLRLLLPRPVAAALADPQLELLRRLAMRAGATDQGATVAELRLAGFAENRIRKLAGMLGGRSPEETSQPAEGQGSR